MRQSTQNWIVSILQLVEKYQLSFVNQIYDMVWSTPPIFSEITEKECVKDRNLPSTAIIRRQHFATISAVAELLSLVAVHVFADCDVTCDVAAAVGCDLEHQFYGSDAAMRPASFPRCVGLHGWHSCCTRHDAAASGRLPVVPTPTRPQVASITLRCTCLSATRHIR